MKTVMDVVRIESDGIRNRFPSPLRKHYSHEPYRKVKSGLKAATAIRPVDRTRVLPLLNRWHTIAPLSTYCTPPAHWFLAIISEIVMSDSESYLENLRQ